MDIMEASRAADNAFRVTGGKFCVIPCREDACDGFIYIPMAQYAPDVDPPTVYITPKGKVY